MRPGTENKYIAGDPWVICDMSGQKYRRSECVLVREPGSTISGLYIHKSLYAPRHPQLDIRGVKDPISIPDARPRLTKILASTDPFVPSDSPVGGDKLPWLRK